MNKLNFKLLWSLYGREIALILFAVIFLVIGCISHSGAVLVIALAVSLLAVSEASDKYRKEKQFKKNVADTLLAIDSYNHLPGVPQVTDSQKQMIVALMNKKYLGERLPVTDKN